MVVDYKHKIGFPGTILIEPKPQEPTKHQYDYDVATVFGFLQRFGLEKEVKLNIEVGHAVLAGHSFEHEIATAVALGVFGWVDANRNDYQSGWDTDQFPNNVPETALAIYYILKAGGFTTGGVQFRQQTPPPVARPRGSDRRAYRRHGRLRPRAAGRGGDDRGRRPRPALAERYAGWDAPEARAMLTSDLAAIAERVDRDGLDPQPRSGRQERLENWVNRFV